MGFFDKLKEQAASLSAQLDQALDTTKTKAQIASLRRTRADMVVQLGEALLEQFRRGEFDPGTLRHHADRIFELERQILELEKQVETQKAAQAQVPTGVGQIPTPPGGGEEASYGHQPAINYCSTCGSQLPEGSSFCPHCGSKVQG